MAKKEKPVCDHFLKDVECNKCGKSFVPTYSWAYKEKRGDKIQYYCTWTCFNHRGGKVDGRKKNVHQEDNR